MTKNINKISINDYVLSYNTEKQKYEYKKVTAVMANGKRDLLKINVGNQQLRLTPDHKVLTSDGYQPALIAKNILTNNGYKEIDSKIETNNEDVYDIEVQDNHNFCVKSKNSNDFVVVHNCRAGAQVPFSSINYGTGTTWEQRTIIKAVLEETDKGLGHGETPIFPVQIFKMKKGINQSKGDPNFDLFELACKVSAKRLFPNFSYIDAPYNLQYYKKGKPETEVAIMGCVDYNTIIDVKKDNVFSKIKIGDFVQKHDALKYKVYDTQARDYVTIKKVIKNPKVSDWYDVTVRLIGEFATSYKTLRLTSTHYMPVLKNGISTRTILTDLKINDEFPCQQHEDQQRCFVDKIEKIKLFEESYCLETETDRFDIYGINSHNCRTRVASNYYDKNNEVFPGRGNISFTTINLPRLGILAKGNINEFFRMFDETIDKVIEQITDRFELIAKKKVFNFPFLMGEGVYVGSDKLKWDDEIRDVLKHGSLSVGFIGLAECLVALIGKHHGESEEARDLGIKIIEHLRKRMDDETVKTGLNWSCFATPAEGLCLAGETLVQTPNGNVPIKDIKVGDLVITFNEKTHTKELKKVLKSWQTSPSRKVLKITFDNGQELICTPNHPIMVRRGVMRDELGRWTSNDSTNEILEWVEAQNLKVGMRIKSSRIELDASGHRMIKNGERLHRMVWEFYNGKIQDDFVIHHRDENKLNNNIENLELMSSKEHKQLHYHLHNYKFTNENTSGENNLFFGKHHTLEAKEKISFTKKLNFNKKKVDDDSLIKMFFDGNTIEQLANMFKTSLEVIKYRLFDELHISNENNHIVVKIEELKDEIPVYDLTIEDNHNFFVGGDNGVLVHNSGRFVKIDKKKFGEIKGVTDRKYYTNSFHVPVYFNTSMFNKINIEAPYHELCNAGAISYVEMDGNLTKNVQAFERVVQYAGEKNMGYFSINHPVDRCPVCGFTGVIDDQCPKCGFKDGEGVNIDELKKRGFNISKMNICHC